MSPKQFSAAWAWLKESTGMSSEQLAAAFGYRRRQTERWSAGDAPIPKLVARVLDWARSGKIKPEDIEP